MNEIQKLAEIEAQYPNEWVLLADPQLDEMTQLLGGRVVFHSPSRDEADQKMLELRLPHFAIRYLGKPRENLVLIL